MTSGSRFWPVTFIKFQKQNKIYTMAVDLDLNENSVGSTDLAKK